MSDHNRVIRLETAGMTDQEELAWRFANQDKTRAELLEQLAQEMD